MARPHDSEKYDLSDAEKRDLIKLIEQGKPLPEKYRFLLFADKREVELVWNGKSREVCTAVLPFQTLEHIDEPRKEQRDQGELGFDMGGRQVKGWTNKLIWGDNKLILSSLKAGALRRQIEEAGGLKLIYIDPPFDVGADFSMDIEIGGETFHKEPNLLEQIAYRDTWPLCHCGQSHRHLRQRHHDAHACDSGVIGPAKPCVTALIRAGGAFTHCTAPRRLSRTNNPDTHARNRCRRPVRSGDEARPWLGARARPHFRR